MRPALMLAILIGAAAAAVLAAVNLPFPSLPGPDPAPRPVEAPAAPDPAWILIELMRGRPQPSTPEVSITTIFREHTFTLLAGEAPDLRAQEALHQHIREMFSLAELASLGSSRVPMTGGSAILDADGDTIEFKVAGEAVSEQMYRIVVSEQRDGREEVATSVIARRGRTLVLAGPLTARAGGVPGFTFVCLTPI